MQGLMERKYGPQTNDLAHLLGKRLAVAAEGENGQRLAESKIKTMTGGDRISCRPLYGNLFEYVPEFKLWLRTNELPTISGTDEAIWRRIRVIEFPITSPPEQQDKRLADRLIAELPGILLWAMQGCMEWGKIGLAPPASVLQSTQEYRKDNNSIGQWIESACSLDPTLRASMKDLYNSYCSWCDSSSLEPLHSTKFGKKLTLLGYETFKAKRSNGRIGIGLKQSPAATGAGAKKQSMSLPVHACAPSVARQSPN